MTARPRVTGIRIEAAQKWKERIGTIRTRDVANEHPHHAAPLRIARPRRIAARQLGSGTDEVTVMEMVIVEFRVGAIARGIADERAPVFLIAENSCAFSFRRTCAVRRNEEVLQSAAQSLGAGYDRR